MSELLPARVTAANKAREYATELYGVLAEVFKPWVGQKIEKVDGTLLAKVAKDLPELPNTVDITVYRTPSDYSLYWKVKVCEMVPPHSCVYEDVSVYVGEMSNGVLTEIIEPAVYNMFTVEGVLEARQKLRFAQDILSKARSVPEIGVFGEYDR